MSLLVVYLHLQNANKTSWEVIPLINYPDLSRDEACFAVGEDWQCSVQGVGYSQESLGNTTALQSGKQMRDLKKEVRSNQLIRCQVKVRYR